MAEQLFLRAIEKEGKFEEIMAQLDHEDDTTVQRLLGWAIAKGKPIGVCVCACCCSHAAGSPHQKKPSCVGNRQCSSPVV